MARHERMGNEQMGSSMRGMGDRTNEPKPTDKVAADLVSVESKPGGP